MVVLMQILFTSSEGISLGLIKSSSCCFDAMAKDSMITPRVVDIFVWLRKKDFSSILNKSFMNYMLTKK